MRNIFGGWKGTQENQKMCNESHWSSVFWLWKEGKQGTCQDMGEGFYTFLEVPRKSVLRCLQGTGIPSWDRLEDSSIPDASRKLPVARLFLSGHSALSQGFWPPASHPPAYTSPPPPPCQGWPLSSPRPSSLSSPTALLPHPFYHDSAGGSAVALSLLMWFPVLGMPFLTLPPWLSPTYSTGRNVNVSCTQPHVN